MDSARKLNRRAFLRWTGLAAGAVTLAACQPKVVEKIVKETVVQEATVIKEATVVQQVDWPVVRWVFQPSSESYADVMAAVNAFQSDKHIRVAFEVVPGDEDALIQRMLAGFAAGDAPDIYGLWGPYTRMCIDKGIALSYNDFVDKEAYKLDQFVKSQIDAATKDGKVYGLPQYCGILAAWYNKDLFEAAGVPFPDKDTWDIDKYIDAAQKICKRDADGNLQVAGCELNNGLEFGLSTAIWSYGGEVSDETRTICKMGEPKAMAALQMNADLIWKHKLTPSAAETTALATSGGWGIFPSGKAAIRDQGSWYFCCGNVEAIGDKFRYGIMPHWKGPDGQRVTLSTTDVYLCNAGTKYPEACWEFLKFVEGENIVRIRAKYEHLQPSLRSLAPEWVQIVKEFAAKTNPKMEDLDVSPYIDGYDYCQPMFWWNCHTSVMEIMNPVLDQIYKTGTGTVQDLIPQVCEQVAKVTC